MLSCVSEIAPFEPGKGLDGFSCLLLGEPQLVEALEIQPEFRTRAKKMREAQGGVARDGAGSVQDLRDPIGRNIDLTCQLSRAHIQRFKLFGQVFAGMDSNQWHSDTSRVIIAFVKISPLHFGALRACSSVKRMKR